MRRKLIIAGVLVVLAVMIWLLFIRPRNDQAETSIVERGDVVEELILSGELQAKEHASLQFQTSGELAEVNVSTGDAVTKGQILGKLNSTNLWAAVQQADAAYRDAQATLNKVYDQLKGREKDESYTQIETRTSAETAKDQAYFALVQARENYSNATIRAPFDGVVTFVANEAPGMNILSTQPQFEIVNLNTMYFVVYADQTEISQIKEGQPVKVVLDAYDSEEVEGVVTKVSIAPSSQEIGVVYPVEIKINRTSINGNNFRIGMTGDATFVTDSSSNVFYLPPQFIKQDSEGSYIILEGNQKRYIEVGTEGEERVEIIGDVNEGLVVYD